MLGNNYHKFIAGIAYECKAQVHNTGGNEITTVLTVLSTKQHCCIGMLIHVSLLGACQSLQLVKVNECWYNEKHQGA